MPNILPKFSDDFLNKTTMYRVVLYYLMTLWAAALILAIFSLLPFNAKDLVLSSIFILAICWAVNAIFAYTFKAPSNPESVLITAFILILIIDPSLPFNNLVFFAWAGGLAMASKYILAINKKHVLNPAAFAVALTALTINQPASWWVGTLYMAPFVLVGGLLLVKKIRRYDLIISFLISSLVFILGYYLYRGQSLFSAFSRTITDTPLLFFTFVMFTEPMTTPATRKLRMIYGAVTGFLYAPFINIGGVFFTPEISLAVGNIFSYIISPRKKLILKLDGKINEAVGVYDFAFISNTGMNFKPGQYMEWTLAHKKADNRGIRRFFTLASSPTEDIIRLGVKFYDSPSTFKSALSNLESGDEIVASELSGDFIMPSDKNKKLAFIAGGIGVTPFRSMIKYLLDKGEARSAVLLYLNQSESEIAYKEIFDEAKEKLEIKTVYILTDESRISPNWTGRRGRLSESMIKEEVSDYLERTFYLSGPHGMVNAYVQTLQKMGVRKGNIKTDYFPGLA